MLCRSIGVLLRKRRRRKRQKTKKEESLVSLSLLLLSCSFYLPHETFHFPLHALFLPSVLCSFMAAAELATAALARIREPFTCFLCPAKISEGERERPGRRKTRKRKQKRVFIEAGASSSPFDSLSILLSAPVRHRNDD